MTSLSPFLTGRGQRRPPAAALIFQERRCDSIGYCEGLSPRAQRLENSPHPDWFAIRPLPASGARCTELAVTIILRRSIARCRVDRGSQRELRLGHDVLDQFLARGAGHLPGK